MYYIVFDLEFNQDFPSIYDLANPPKNFFEIIQIGATKLDSDFHCIATFNRYIKPTVYQAINPFITELTSITTNRLSNEQTFPQVYQEYIGFIKDPTSVLCVWGMSDLKALYRNAQYHQLNISSIPKTFINIQPYTSVYLGIGQKTLLSLQNAVDALAIPITSRFHTADNDAYYTAEIFKKIYTPTIVPKFYNANDVSIRPRQPKKLINTLALYQQFEKMYARELNDEEKEIILLAYKMGKTHQFLK